MATKSDFTFLAYERDATKALNAAQATSAGKIRNRYNRLESYRPGDYIILNNDDTLTVMPKAAFEAELGVVATPSAPTSLATSAQTDASITLTWTDAVVADFVNVYRDGVLIATVADGVETYVDNDAALTPNTAYSYQLETVKTEQKSAKTSALVAYTDPSAPTNCAVEITGATTATVTWTDVPGDEDVEYQVDVDGTPSGTTVAAGVGSKDITGLTTTTEYDFTVRAIGLTSSQSSVASNTATDTTE